jgi:superfamily II DNA or RNA helicase
MPIPKEIIDNSEGNRLVSFLKDSLQDIPKSNLDIATAFFDIKAFAMMKENLGGVSRFRLLLGKEPEFRSEQTLGDALLEEVKREVEGFDLTKDSESLAKSFIEFLNKPNVEVRLFEDFLHGKAYIFDDRVVVGSSNFTAAGLTRYGELNTWKQESQARFTRDEWFEKFWGQSKDFKEALIALLKESRFGDKEYMPYEIYIKTLYELQRADVEEEEKEGKRDLPETKVDLTRFQEDAIARINTRLKKYGGCIVADSVGLGKTWIAKKIIESIGFYKRQKILVVCPAQLRGMWRKELKNIDVSENVLSQEDLASKNFLKKAATAVGGRLEAVKLIVVDESHNFRNPLSNRWENFFTLVSDHMAKGGKKPHILFLTATPINNTVWDLYWQIMLLVLKEEDAFIKENIPYLFKFFKSAKDKPALLNDLLNEISIRRTRDYIVKNYPEAYITVELPSGEKVQEKVSFPKRCLEPINYELDKSYKGMYGEISAAISDKLTMAYYKMLKYRKEGIKTKEDEFLLNRMIQIGGIFKTILLKRLESSVEAFRISIGRHIKFLERLKQSLKAGKIISKQDFNKLVEVLDRVDDEEIEEFLDRVESWEGIKLEVFKKEDYNVKELFVDIDKDISILKSLLKNVGAIKPEEDAKLKVLKERLLKLSKEGQIVLFTYYSDTLGYIYRDIMKDKRFSKLKIEALSSSGQTGKSSPYREKIVEKFTAKKIDILMSTDVLSEGQNLQTAKYLINYDLHWNPTRMIQRAGRIDRIGSPYKEIFVYNFFPEDELEELLKLVEILQKKIIGIDTAVGLDQSVLGEVIHPKVFGVIRRIKAGDNRVFSEIEQEAYGGGELFYQPLKDFMKNRALEELKKIPNGVYSGLRKGKIRGVFMYYKYGEDFHFWYLYDIAEQQMLTNKTQIIDYISCKQDEKRSIPEFFDKVYEVNGMVRTDIEKSYSEIATSRTQDSGLRAIVCIAGNKFIKDIIDTVEARVTAHIEDFPQDREVETAWDAVKAKLCQIKITKKRAQVLRRYWRAYKRDENWKRLINELGKFLQDKGVFERIPLAPFDESKLKMITIDFIS